MLREELTKKTVQALITTVESIVKTHNIDQLAKLLSEDINIKINIKNNGNNQTMKITKSQYLSMLKQGWEMCENYTYKISDINITIKNGLAYVTSKLEETMICNNQQINSTSYEKSIIKLIDNKLKVTEITASMKL
ncbi:hypothetical protein [Arcobacter sp. FWKO B]|uniref:hypothetical protein n=1 Tax=Arcobacter sp. FWKO B TaxID=2593672 RepID=UPI0018A5FC6C|nr:hypothetical protein [Arcobacter sp. FWKO B]QOG12433.1 hypothetical protein FWKOB_06845 [Arcobacter sp. FWKO B]